MSQIIKIFIFSTLALFFLGCSRTLEPVASLSLSKEALNDQEIVAELYTLQRHYIQQLSLLENNSTEAKNLQKSYNKSIRNVLPDLDNAVSLTGVEQLDHNTLLLDRDMLLPLNTFKGAIELLMLDALASGRDVEELHHIIAEEAAKDSLQDRAVYNANVSKWPVKNSKYYIPYKFGIIRTSADDTILYKRKVREAIEIWEEASANRIEFVETDFDTLSSGARKLTINLNNNPSPGVLGNAYVGAYSFSEVNIFQNNIAEVPLSFIKDKETLILAVVLHELGHTLGFHHEHQRGDRNTYVNTESDDDVNFGLLELYGEFSTWEVKTFTLPDGTEVTFDVPPAVGGNGYQLKSYATSPYDYLSIMHYNGLLVKIAKQGYRVGERVSLNDSLSVFDKQGVKLLYPLLSQ